jgi:hypothetical protein
MSFFRKISLFFTYRNILNSISKELEIEYGTRIDNIYRMYTVLNIPETIFEEPYNLRRTDIDNLSRNYILDFRKNMSSYLVSKGLLELFDTYEIRKVDKYSYLIIMGYALFNTRKVANNLIISSIILSILLIFFVIGMVFYKTLL